jgi:hypothetical protein
MLKINSDHNRKTYTCEDSMALLSNVHVEKECGLGDVGFCVSQCFLEYFF